LFRFRVYWFAGDGLYGNVLRDMAWPNQDVSISAQNEAARAYAANYLQTKFASRPDLLEKMLPDYPIFGKRIVLDADDGWLDTLKKPNVVLETGGIDHIESDAVVLQDGTRVEADIIILATGFELAPALGPIKLYGRGGIEAGETWGDDARAYLGILAPNYPNFFMILGPNSSPNHAAGVNMVIEAQINYIIESLDLLIAKQARSIEPRDDAYIAWNEQVEEQMKSMVWTHPKCSSYYLNSKRRNWVSCPFRLADYWAMTRHPREQDLVVD
jgi:4-hydroxyacetophenone monooxygenase